MIGIEDAPYTYEYSGYYKILPSINNWSLDPYRINNGKNYGHGGNIGNPFPSFV